VDIERLSEWFSVFYFVSSAVLPGCVTVLVPTTSGGLMSDTPTDRYTELATKLAECQAEKIRLHRITDEMIERAVLAHTKAEGFISPTDDAYVSMRAALRAALEVTDGI
jgi:hypothetical protein